MNIEKTVANIGFAQWLRLGQLLENPVGFSNICFIFVVVSHQSRATDAKPRNVNRYLRNETQGRLRSQNM